MPALRHLSTVVLLAACLACTAAVYAGVGSREEVDSSLVARYLRCEQLLDGPGGVERCDSLFEQAGLLGDVKMQAAVLCLKLDHHYNVGDEVGLREGVHTMQEFYRDHNDPQVRYFYYYGWSNRLIAHYIKQNKSNAAVYQTRKMLSSALAENYAEGIASGYQMLGNIYFREGAYRLAYDNYQKEIQTVEAGVTDDLNLPKRYAMLAECALKLNLADSALVTLRKAAKVATTSPYQQLMVNRVYTLYYLDRQELDRAALHLDVVRGLLKNNPELAPFCSTCYELKTQYYKKRGHYDHALEVVASRRVVQGACDEDNRYKLCLDEGEIYWLKGAWRQSAERYREYIRLADSVRRREVRSATDDFTGLLEVEQLRGETHTLQVDLQHKRLRNTYLVIGLLMLLLFLVVLGLTRAAQLYRRLKASEAKVKAQNDDLRATGEELRLAIQRAEQASRMKTDFLQHMSHEIRTPLNAIVGFSQVLASVFRKDRETIEYATIIEQNSENLLRLIDDVLDIASLDRTQLLPTPDCGEMNSPCRECVGKMLNELRPGVALVFEESSQNPVVRTNVRRIEQVLMHLLHNAAKFTPTGEIILNYTYLPEREVLRFVVSDTGPGIPEEVRDSIFERFFKVDAFAQGTGLGLSICRIVAEKLGGSLYLDSTYERGCRMVFEVPVAVSERQP